MQVRDVARAIGEWDEERLRSGYARILRDDYGGDKSEEDFAYTWGWFSEVQAFFRKAAEARRWVLFTADR